MSLLNVPQQTDRDRIASTSAMTRLAKSISPKKSNATKVGIRQGVVTAVSVVTNGLTPTYTVTVGGTSVTATCIGTCGPLAGDTVMIVRQGPDWMILGLAPASAGLKSFTPTLLGSVNNPVIGTDGVKTGHYRMISPTTMWVSGNIQLGTAAHGAAAAGGYYLIGGLPLSIQFDQILPVLLNTGSGSYRWAGMGWLLTSVNPKQICRIAVGGVTPGFGTSSGMFPEGVIYPAPTYVSGVPGDNFRVQFTGTLEVDPSGA